MDMDGRDPEPSASQDGGAFLSALVGQTSAYDPFSPISNLPSELISLIIMLARPPRRVPHKVPYEVNISHVSKLWREVVLDMPLLWATVDIYSAHSTSWVPAYIRRSGQRPLDFHIDIYRYDKRHKGTARSQQQIFPLIEGILQAMNRVRSIQVLCAHQHTAVILQDLFASRSAPLLESLNVQHGTCFSDIDRAMGLKSFIFNQGLPRLITLITDTPNILPRATMLRNLTTFYWHGLDPKLAITANDFQHTLSSLSSLVHLSLQGTVGFAFWPTGMPAGPQVILPSLKSLRCLDGGGLAIRALLAISAPKLESIWLECSFDNFPAHLFGAPQMNVAGRPKFPALKYLTLHYEGSFALSEQFAKVFPNITHFHYFHVDLRRSNELVKTMMNRWKSVRTLVFSRFRERDADKLTTALSQIVLTRRLGVAPIQDILLDQDHMNYLKKTPTNPTNDVLTLAKVVSRDNYAEHWWNTFEKGIC